MLSPSLRPNLRFLRHVIAPPPRYRYFSNVTDSGPVDILSIDEASLNDTLLSLALSGQFSAAERLRLKLASNGLFVRHRAEYANIALACLRNCRLTGGMGLKFEEYMTWLQLIPDRRQLYYNGDDRRRVVSPFDSIVKELTSRALIKKFLPFVSSTGVLLASKGYARHHLLDIARPVILFADPRSPAIDSLILWECRAAGYEEYYGYSGEPVARYIRGLLVRMFVERGWVREGGELMLKERGYGLEDVVYESVLEKLGRGRRLKRLISERWEMERKSR